MGTGIISWSEIVLRTMCLSLVDYPTLAISLRGQDLLVEPTMQLLCLGNSFVGPHP
jgi:hypothetical protein